MALIRIDGVVDGPKDDDEFLDKFIEFVEANGWTFGGGVKELDEDEE